jgi:histidine ammonia-lyase
MVVIMGTGPLTDNELIRIARHGEAIELDASAVNNVGATRTAIEALANDPDPNYGISTGFGALATTFIPEDQRAQLQRSLIRSHAAGTGPEIETEVIRGLMAQRLSTLMTGRTGVRSVVVETYAAVLNAGLTPIVYEYGSLGCSGDLAPLAHCALVLMGEGRVRNGAGVAFDSADALAAAGITPVELREKEGLALINGTDGMTAMLLLAIEDMRHLLRVADIALSISVEGLLATDKVFADDLMTLRPHPGQRAAAGNVRALLDGSPLVASHAGPDDTRVQDAYSIRCAPQVHGAARDTVDHAERVARLELASAIDNPVVTLDYRVESNGNFHGAPVGYVLDFLAIAVADVASMSERRTDRFLDHTRSYGLPPFLAHEAGVDSGLMIAQYTAAGIVSELKRLAMPASVDSIPSSAMQEDHVSMGWAAGRKLRRAIDGLSRVLAIEILTASRGAALRDAKASAATGPIIDLVNTASGGPGADRFLSPEIDAVVALVQSGQILATAEKTTGTLN